MKDHASSNWVHVVSLADILPLRRQLSTFKVGRNHFFIQSGLKKKLIRLIVCFFFLSLTLFSDPAVFSLFLFFQWGRSGNSGNYDPQGTFIFLLWCCSNEIRKPNLMCRIKNWNLIQSCMLSPCKTQGNSLPLLCEWVNIKPLWIV